jgi:predicted lipid-binding transport protein (Tim44 family)
LAILAPARFAVSNRAIGWAKFVPTWWRPTRDVTLALPTVFWAEDCSAGSSPALIRKQCDVSDIYTYIFLALAVFIFLRLRSVLGQRTGAERPPYDRAARDVVQGAQDDNIVPMPGKAIDPAPSADVAPPSDRWKGLAEPGTPLALGLDAVAALDTSFDPQHFISGARGAYEMIVLAFANGDRRALRDLLSSEVYESFETVIRDREKHEQKTETRFVSIDKAELVSAEVRDRTAQLTVRFVSQMISVTRDKAGAIVDGNPEKVTDITDVWTFARDSTSRDPNWKLVGTGSVH